MGRYRKNVKRIDPRYFMDEKSDVPLNEVGGGADPPRFSPLSATTPGERIPVPGSQRPLEKRGLGGNVDDIATALTDVDEAFEALTAVVAAPDASGFRGAPPELWKLRNAIGLLSARIASLQNRVGEDPRAPRLEEG